MRRWLWVDSVWRVDRFFWSFFLLSIMSMIQSVGGCWREMMGYDMANNALQNPYSSLHKEPNYIIPFPISRCDLLPT